MPANLPSLNQSKTEYMFIGLLKRFLISLILLFSCPPMSLLLLQTQFIILVLFSTHLSYSQIIFHPCLNHDFYPFMTFIESAILLKPLQPFSFIAWSTTATHSFSIFFAVDLIAFNSFSTLQLKLYLKPLDSAISHSSSNLHNGFKVRQSQTSSYLYNPFNLQVNTSTRSASVITVNSRLKRNVHSPCSCTLEKSS